MRDALDHPDLGLLLDERLIDALRLAGVSPVTLTAQGLTYQGRVTMARRGDGIYQRGVGEA
jgi:hypothetical protein